MRLTMRTLQQVLIHLCIYLSMVDCNSLHERSPPRHLLMEDPSGNYSLLNSSDTHSGGDNGHSTQHQEYLHILRTGMYILSGSNHSLAKFLLTSQRQLVCPDEKHCKMQNHRGRLEVTRKNNLGQIKWGTNYDWGWRDLVMQNSPTFEFMTSRGLYCTDREWFSPEENQLVIYTLHFRLIPGVCFTRYQNISFCDKPKILFPMDSKCIRFFRGANCRGEMADIYYGGLDVLESAIVGSGSFAFC